MSAPAASPSDPPKGAPEEADLTAAERARFEAARQVRGPLASADEPLITSRRIARSLLRAALVMIPLGLVGLLAGGAEVALFATLYGFALTPAAWVEFWAERRPGSSGNDLRAVALAGALSWLFLVLIGLQGIYLEAVVSDGSMDAGVSALQRVVLKRPLKLFGIVLACFLPGAGIGFSIFYRLRRYLPAEARGASRSALALSLTIVVSLGLVVGADVALALVVAVGVFLAIVRSLSLVYAWADSLELEHHLWRERRAADTGGE